MCKEESVKDQVMITNNVFRVKVNVMWGRSIVRPATRVVFLGDSPTNTGEETELMT